MSRRVGVRVTRRTRFSALSPRQVEAVREQAGKVPQREMAASLGVSQSTVSAALIAERVDPAGCAAFDTYATTLEDVGRELGITRERARQIQAEALRVALIRWVIERALAAGWVDDEVIADTAVAVAMSPITAARLKSGAVDVSDLCMRMQCRRNGVRVA